MIFDHKLAFRPCVEKIICKIKRGRQIFAFHVVTVCKKLFCFNFMLSSEIQFDLYLINHSSENEIRYISNDFPSMVYLSKNITLNKYR